MDVNTDASQLSWAQQLEEHQTHIRRLKTRVEMLFASGLILITATLIWGPVAVWKVFLTGLKVLLWIVS